MSAPGVILGATTRSKYGAKPTIVDGIRFASQAEAKRYSELRLLEKAGEIRDLTLQPRFELWAFNVDPSKAQPVGSYVADFSYTAVGYRPLLDLLVVEDVKGMRSLPLARWKQKHLLAQYGIRVTEIRSRG